MVSMVQVESSNVAAVGYDNGALFVEFHGSGTYRYDKVPRELYDEFLAAESAGRFFAANVRGKFGHKPVPVEPEPASRADRS